MLKVINYKCSQFNSLGVLTLLDTLSQLTEDQMFIKRCVELKNWRQTHVLREAVVEAVNNKRRGEDINGTQH